MSFAPVPSIGRTGCGLEQRGRLNRLSISLPERSANNFSRELQRLFPANFPVITLLLGRLPARWQNMYAQIRAIPQEGPQP